MKTIRLRSLTRNAFAIGLVGALAVTGFTACSYSPDKFIPAASSKITEADIPDTKTTESEMTEARSLPGLGGWVVSKDYNVTEDLNKLFKKAMSKIVGADYTPVAYLGSQVVSGTNHCFLCQEKIVYPGAAPRYAFVYIHEDANKDAGLCNINDIVLPGTSESLSKDITKPGGWSFAEDYKITDKLSSVIEKASQAKLGAKYEPVANIGSQLVSGTNHAVLCKITTVTPNSDSHYALVYVYESLDGKCEITDIKDIELFAE